MQIRSGSALESNINVTPLVDICLVLLIIFMIVVPAMVTGIPVQLPTAKGDPSPDASKQTVITVKSDGSIYIDHLVIRRDEFRSEIGKMYARYPKKPLAVRGDRTLGYADIVDVLDTCRAAGYSDVRLMTSGPATH